MVTHAVVRWNDVKATSADLDRGFPSGECQSEMTLLWDVALRPARSRTDISRLDCPLVGGAMAQYEACVGPV